MIRLMMIVLSLVLRTSPDRFAPGHVLCYDTQGHRVEFVVLVMPSSQAQFCRDRGLLSKLPAPNYASDSATSALDVQAIADQLQAVLSRAAWKR
jgi:hypothetical protein